MLEHADIDAFFADKPEKKTKETLEAEFLSFFKQLRTPPYPAPDHSPQDAIILKLTEKLKQESRQALDPEEFDWSMVGHQTLAWSTIDLRDWSSIGSRENLISFLIVYSRVFQWAANGIKGLNPESTRKPHLMLGDRAMELISLFARIWNESLTSQVSH
jgi:hypothetical protein